ncbi:MAG: DUF4145 domain-containing protein [Nanoarchaeota archaeon]
MNKFSKAHWESISNRVSKSFICWNCNKQVASEKAYATYDPSIRYSSFIYICPHCNAPNIYDDEKREVLLPLPGKEINKLPENILVVYSEIRKCMQSGCFNGAIMLMRKLIMHIAVEERAEEGKNFIEYIDYLYNNGNIPKKSKNKSDSVRTLGNNTNHKIENRTSEEAQNCFELVELLLKVNYEFADEEKN